MVFCIDADNTIFYNDKNYNITGVVECAKEFINRLYDEGNIIIIWSSRNCDIFDGHHEVLNELKYNLEKYGIKYDWIDDGKHGKLPADLYIDDKAISFKGRWDAELEGEIKFRKSLLGENTFDNDYIDFLKDILYGDEDFLYEYTIKQLRDRASERVRKRARDRSIDFVGFYDDRAEFLAKGGDDNYAIIVKFLDFWKVLSDDRIKLARDKAREIMMNGDVEIYCSCPAYLYGGYQYYGTKKDYNLSDYPEHRVPQPHKPDGWVCKHLVVTLQSLPFYISELAGHINKYLK